MQTPFSNLTPENEATVPTAQSAIPIRPTRKQVSRACDWCRARRIKCDNERPCRACLARNADCTHKGGDEPRTLPQALREIEKLKSQVKTLEAEVSKYRHQKSPDSQLPNPKSNLTKGHDSSFSTREDQDSLPASCSSSGESPSLNHGTDQRPDSSQPQVFATSSDVYASPKPQWEGIHVATARSEQTSYYGTSSYYYFVSRIGAYLVKALQQPFAERSMQPRGANRTVILSSANDADVDVDVRDGHFDFTSRGGHQRPSMNRSQEEYFLSLFWEGQHCSTPIIDEFRFRRHYVSLWESGKPYRKNSPLVDIILALCLQYGYMFIPRHISRNINRDNDHHSNSNKRSKVNNSNVENTSSDGDTSFDDATIAGRWYYRRSQALLTADLESPSLTTVQCYIFTFSYLCCASFQNMCHVTLAQAIRTAQIIGLHLDPPETLPRGERELRRRIWWVLFTLELKTSGKLGRPCLMDRGQMTTAFPSDDLETAAYNGATLGSYGPDVTWLTYSIHYLKLMHDSFDIGNALISKFGELMEKKKLSCIYTDAHALETCAELLASRLPSMTAWVDNVPQQLKTLRRGGCKPYATDRSTLEIDCMAPVWLRRQRVWLELMYHSMMANLSRPFITFYSTSSTYTPLAERHATACVAHCISHTLIMHQVVTETDLMCGWTEFFMWQWNATITIIGFILAYPIHSSTPSARKALDKATAIFDSYGTDFAVAVSAAQITRDLTGKADLLADRLRHGIIAPSSSFAATDPMIGTDGKTNQMDETHHHPREGPQHQWGWEPQHQRQGLSDDSLRWLDPGQQDISLPNDFMDWALSVNSFNSFERFFDASNPADPWAFGHF